MYKAVKIVKGPGGWGGPLVIQPTEQKNKVVSVTGGGIHPVAKKIAELTGAVAIDGFTTGVPDSEIAVVVVDCGGTARCGVYPKKKVFTVNVTAVGQSGPLAMYIKEDIYVSGCTVNDIKLVDSTGEVVQAKVEEKPVEEKPVEKPKIKPIEDKGAEKAMSSSGNGGFVAIINKIGKGVGGVVGKLYQAGRDTIETVIKNILPFMAFVTMLIGIITKSGIGNWIANHVTPFVSTLPGMLLISVICAIPFLSPLLGPGAVISQIVGVLVGVQIGQGHIPPQYALPALFAINPQVGCDFVPVGLSLGEAAPETIEIGVPAVLFSRLITGPIAVIIAYFASFGLYT